MTIKLGPHSLVEVGDTVRWANVLAPTVLKLCYDFSPAPFLPADVFVIGRADENYIKGLFGDPIALARQVAAEFYAPLIRYNPRIDAWEGPNEVNPANPAEMQWYASFLAQLGYEIRALGKTPVVGNWATGTPEVSMWQYYRPVLKMCKEVNGLLSRHSYSPLDTWHMLRHRQDQAAFNAMGYNPELVITECGMDVPDPAWKSALNGDIRRYWQEILKPFLLELNKDDYVLGATLFTVGTGFSQGWVPFDVSGTGLIELMQADLDEIAVKDKKIMADTITVEGNNIAATSIVVGTQGSVYTQAQLKIAQFMRELGYWLSGFIPAIVLGLPEAGYRTMLFDAPGSITPKFWRPTWNMNVSQKVVDAEGVVWYKVNDTPPMWVLAAHVKSKS